MTCVSKNCSSILSSNCVVWKGPNIPCISLSTGDSVSDVISKLATLLCDASLGAVDISTVNFSCLVEGLGSQPETLQQILQLIIDKVCTIEDIVTTPEGANDPIIQLPGCLHFDELGVPIVELPLTEYAVNLAENICSILNQITTINNTLTALDGRVTTIEQALLLLDAPDLVLPNVNISCVDPLLNATSLVNGIETLATAFCTLQSVLGDPSDIVNAISQQCTDLSTQDSLSGIGTMAEIPGWSVTPETAADALNNLWLTLCDLRNSVVQIAVDIQPKCKDVDLDFNFTFSPDRTSGELTLYTYSYIPEAFVNNVASSLTISDGLNTYTQPINVKNMSESAIDNVTVNLLAAGIDVTKNITVSVFSSLTSPDTTVCENTETKIYEYQCITSPISFLTVFSSTSSANVSWNAPSSPEPVINYTYQILEAGILIRTISVSQTNATVGGLTPGNTYTIRVVANYACGVSTPISENFTLQCYQITSAYAFFDPCTVGTGDEYLGGQIQIGAPAEQDVNFRIVVQYVTTLSGATCNAGIYEEVTLTGVIPLGQTTATIHPCSAGVLVPGGGSVCNISAELLDGCASGNNTNTCTAPYNVTAQII